MQKIIQLFILLIISGVNVWGSPYVKLGFTGTPDDGYGDAGGVITPWLSLDTSDVGMYAGGKLSAVEIDLGSRASNVYVYVRRDRNDSDNIYRQKVGTLEAGHHMITLDTPVDIDGQPIAIGYKATFSSAKGALFGQPFNDRCSHAYYNTKNTWIDIRGSFCIAATIEGDNLPANELGVVSLSDGKKLLNATSTPVTLTVKNLGTEVVSSFSVNYDIDSRDMLQMSWENLNILPGEEASVEIDVPETGTGTHQIHLTITSVNGSPDAYTANNTATSTVTEPDPTFVRRIVAEEATGTWCSWCPRGIVGLEMMKDKYPDEFIAVALHTGDEFEAPGFSASLSKMPSLPHCLVNRHNTGDPYEDIERLFLAEQSTPTGISFNIEAGVLGNTINTHVKVLVDHTTDASGLYFAFTTLEDNLMGIQNNAYSGRTEEYMGEWLTRPSSTRYMFKDVARGIAPSYDGTPLLSGTLSPGETYEADFSFDLPASVADINNVRIVGMLLDHSNGFILNAHEVKPQSDTGISDIAVDKTATVSHTCVYSPDGKLLLSIDGDIDMAGVSGFLSGMVIVSRSTPSGKIISKHILK